MATENTARTAEPQGQNDEGTAEPAQSEKEKRERSSIAFPYDDLEDAIEIARAIHDHVGTGDCDDNQLSAWVGMSQKSSGYRQKLTAARLFGVMDPNSERRRLTPLGRMVVDPKQERAARDAAFLRVPLYSALYEKYKDGVLPPTDALEREIVSLGVASKQKDRARQVFERSAQQAGYFEQGRNRLVRPGVAPLPNHSEAEGSKGGGGGGSGSGSGGGGDDPPHHPLIQGLFQSLPTEEKWTVEDAAEWLEAAAVNLRIAYKFKGRIKVTVERNQDQKAD